MARKWTEAEDQIIRDNYGTLTNRDIAEEIGDCIPLQVFRRAIKLGLEAEPSKSSKRPASQPSPVNGGRSQKPAKRTRALVEPEIEAMQGMMDLLLPLEQGAQKRVMLYVNARLNVFKFSTQGQANDGN